MKNQQDSPFCKVAIDLLSMSKLIPVSDYLKPDADIMHIVDEMGVYPPVFVRPLQRNVLHQTYEIIYGEEYWFAAQDAMLPSVYVQILDTFTDRECMEIRRRLSKRKKNNPIDLAMEISNQLDRLPVHKRTISRAGAILGYSRQRARNLYRMLELPDDVKNMIEEGTLTEGHAKLLLSLDVPAEVVRLSKRIASENISCAQLQDIVRDYHAGKAKKKRQKGRAVAYSEDWATDVALRTVEEVLTKTLGCKATLDTVSKNISFMCGRMDIVVNISEGLTEEVMMACQKIEIDPIKYLLTLSYGGRSKVESDNNLDHLLVTLLGDAIEEVRG